MSAETTSIMAHTENSEEGGVPSNIQSTYTTPNSLAAGDVIESNEAMFCALFDRSFAGEPYFYGYPTAWALHPNVKCSRSTSWHRQLLRWLLCIMQIRWLQRSTGNSENSDNSDSGEDDEENDRRNRVTIHEKDRSPYN